MLLPSFVDDAEGYLLLLLLRARMICVVGLCLFLDTKLSRTFENLNGPQRSENHSRSLGPPNHAKFSQKGGNMVKELVASLLFKFSCTMLLLWCLFVLVEFSVARWSFFDENDPSLQFSPIDVATGRLGALRRRSEISVRLHLQMLEEKVDQLNESLQAFSNETTKYQARTPSPPPPAVSKSMIADAMSTSLLSVKQKMVIREARERWKIVAELNDGFMDLFCNWYASVEKLDLGVPIWIYAHTAGVYEALQLIRLDKMVEIKKLWELTTSQEGFRSGNITKASQFKSKDYLSMVSRRGTILMDAMKDGRHLLYTDIDSVMLRNPFLHIPSTECDMSFQLDNREEGKSYCTGIFTVRNRMVTRALIGTWNSALQAREQLNQPLMRELVNLYTANHGLKACALDGVKFASGKTFFHQNKRRGTVILHANYYGSREEKIKVLSKVGLWNPQMLPLERFKGDPNLHESAKSCLKPRI